jgi:hypothetical protein
VVCEQIREEALEVAPEIPQGNLPLEELLVLFLRSILAPVERLCEPLVADPIHLRLLHLL